MFAKICSIKAKTFSLTKKVHMDHYKINNTDGRQKVVNVIPEGYGPIESNSFFAFAHEKTNYLFHV
jgi:hypothetical protein